MNSSINRDQPRRHLPCDTLNSLPDRDNKNPVFSERQKDFAWASFDCCLELSNSYLLGAGADIRVTQLYKQSQASKATWLPLFSLLAGEGQVRSCVLLQQTFHHRNLTMLGQCWTQFGFPVYSRCLYGVGKQGNISMEIVRSLNERTL